MSHNLNYKEPPTYKKYVARSNKKFSGQAMISEKEFNTIRENNCKYCGNPGPNGIDRVDNSKGYQKENCVPCCKHCNYIKGDLSISDYTEWRDRFVKHNSIIGKLCFP